MKKNKIVLFIIIIGLLPFLIPNNNDNYTLISQNQTKFDEKHPSQDNSFTPKTQDDSPSSKIQFNSSEMINRSYSNVGPNSTALSFETPSSYDIFNANIDFQVMNATVDEDVVESDNDGFSIEEKAQSFYIDEISYLLGFSIYIKGKVGPTSPIMEIRNNSFIGESLYSFTPSFPILDGWFNISFSEQIILTEGKYFLWIEKLGNSLSNWKHNSVNDTETWEFNGITWVDVGYDLTLKVNYSDLINPEDVEMKVNNLPVIDTIPGEGKINIEGEIISSDTTLNVTATESISFFYSLNGSFYRNRSIQIDTQIQQDWINWNLTLDSGYFDDPYSNYRINVSGIKNDYYDIQVFNQTDVIGYSSISSEVIGFTSEATHIIFKSLNYIDSVILDNYMQIGSITTINVSVMGIGDIYAYIWDDETLIHQNSSYNVSYQSFQWYLGPLIDSNSLTVEIFFNGSNEMGYYSETVNISKVSEIISIPIHGNALDNFTFSCQYRDHYSQLPISDGIITYDFGVFSGEMEMDQNGNYSNTIDLSQYGILPGEYSISVTAEKENYGLIYSEIPIVINPRIVTMELSKSRKTISPGNTIDFELNLKDIGNEPYLLRAVDIEIRIFHSGNHLNGDLVYFETLKGIYSKGEFSWKVPSDIEEGSYDIVVDVISDYYTGSLNLERAVEVISSIFWLISLPIFIGLISSLVGGYFIKKVKTKKSLLGLMILHDNGAPLAEKISYQMKKSDSALVSGAFIGILSLIKEITGSQLRTIEIEGGYVNLVHGDSFWLILFIKNNPRLIEKAILKLKDEIQLDFGQKIIGFNGRTLEIPLDELIKKYFNTVIQTEPINEDKLSKEKFAKIISSHE